VQEDEAKNGAFAAVALRGCCGDDDALGGDHLAHHASGGVGRGHQIRRNVELLRGEFLQAAEEDVGRGVGAGGGSADPADEGAEEGIEGAGPSEGEAEGRVHSAIACDEADGHQCSDGDEREADGHQGLDKDMGDGPRPHTHEQAGEDSGDEDAGAGGGEPVEVEDCGLGCWRGDGGRHSQHQLVQAVDWDLHAGGGIDSLGEARHAP